MSMHKRAFTASLLASKRAPFSCIPIIDFALLKVKLALGDVGNGDRDGIDISDFGIGGIAESIYLERRDGSKVKVPGRWPRNCTRPTVPRGSTQPNSRA